MKPNIYPNIKLFGNVPRPNEEVHEASQVPKVSRLFGNLEKEDTGDVNPFLFVNSASHD